MFPILLLALAQQTITGPEFKKWSCPIPYQIDSTLINPSRVIDAMNYISNMTGWSFIERTEQDDFLNFIDADNCASYLGRAGGKQNIFLSEYCSYGAGIHEIVHAIGVMHEQSRIDRDEYIEINYDEIKQKYIWNFDKSHYSNIGNYDYNSIMQYGRWAFSSSSEMTIKPINKLCDVCYIGQDNKLSSGDIIHLNKLIDGDHCSSSYQLVDTCNPENIEICGAKSLIQNPSIFSEYKIIGKKNGKNHYQSILDYVSIEIYFQQKIFSSYWVIKLNNIIYARNYNEDIFSNNWKIWNQEKGWFYDPIIITNKQCCNISSKNLGNGICDSQANNKECYWDGGDCCKESCIGSLCSNHLCKDPLFLYTQSNLTCEISCAYVDTFQYLIFFILLLIQFLNFYLQVI